MTDDPNAWRDWIGRSERRVDRVTAAPLAALSATLDRDDPAPAPGDPVPPLWHWLYFTPLTPQREIGPDGHALRGGFLPPVPLPRRMWAGGRLAFARPLAVGDEVVRTSSIADVSVKSGRSGTLVFVSVHHEIADARGVAITEEHDIVYRDAPPRGAAAGGSAPTPAPSGEAYHRAIVPDPVLLFRYSALTFNGHRIHYDRSYVTDVEGYPGLVVHGPLTQTLLIDFARDHAGGRRFVSWTTQARAPLFEPQPFELRGRPTAGGCELWAVTPEGTVAMSALAELA